MTAPDLRLNHDNAARIKGLLWELEGYRRARDAAGARLVEAELEARGYRDPAKAAEARRAAKAAADSPVSRSSPPVGRSARPTSKG